MTFPRRREVYLVRFDPAEGSEIRKTRPALILQNDIGNRYSSTVIVAAITSKFDDKQYPTEVPISAPEGGLAQDSNIRLDHIRPLGKTRLIKRLGKLKPKSMKAVDRAVKISLGLVEL